VLLFWNSFILYQFHLSQIEAGEGDVSSKGYGLTTNGTALKRPLQTERSLSESATKCKV